MVEKYIAIDALESINNVVHFLESAFKPFRLFAVLGQRCHKVHKLILVSIDRAAFVMVTYQNSRISIDADGNMSEFLNEVQKNAVPVANTLGNHNYSLAVLIRNLYYS